MQGQTYHVTVCVCPTVQTTPWVGYVTGGAATSKGSRTASGLAFTRQERYARAMKVIEENETMLKIGV